MLALVVLPDGTFRNTEPIFDTVPLAVRIGESTKLWMASWPIIRRKALICVVQRQFRRNMLAEPLTTEVREVDWNCRVLGHERTTDLFPAKVAEVNLSLLSGRNADFDEMFTTCHSLFTRG